MGISFREIPTNNKMIDYGSCFFMIDCKLILPKFNLSAYTAHKQKLKNGKKLSQ